MTATVYLDQAGLAQRVGLSASTVRAYLARSPHLLPAPDARVGDKVGWLESTVDAWVQQRPGAGRTESPRAGRP